jgi:hypothetical protein
MKMQPTTRMMRNKFRHAIGALTPGLLALFVLAGPGLAHHSFAVFFDDTRTVTVRGTVADFQFRNPHGMIRVKAAGPDGAEQLWRVETNSPSILERRGWARETLKVGDGIIVDGWPARDGSNWLRMRSVRRADGSPVGTGFETIEAQK